MSKKENKTTSKKKDTSKKKVKFVLKKPDFSKLKEGKWEPILKNIGLVLIIVGSFAAIDLLVQYLNNDYSVAVVNGVRVSKSKWHNQLENTYGEAVAEQLIEEEIIRQEAKIAEVSVSTEEIDERIDEIKESIGGEEMFESALEANSITLEELRDQIELDILTQKLLEPSLEYTDDDVKAFFEQYSDVIFPEETAALEEGEKLSYDDYKEETEEVYTQQQVQTESSAWLTEKKAEYKIQNNATDKPGYGFLTTTRNIIKNISNDANETEETE
jgi:foldase protein PrsA